MKDQFLSSIHEVIRDRQLTTLLGVFLFLCLALLIYIGASLHPSELQVVVHHTSYGPTNFYRDKWYYLVSFAVFVVIVAMTQCLLAYKLLQAKGHSFAVAFIWLGYIVLVVSAVFFYQVLNIASLS